MEISGKAYDKMEILQTINANANERSSTFPIYCGKENVPFASSSQVKLDQLESSYNAKTPLWNETSLPIPRLTSSRNVDSEELTNKITDTLPVNEASNSKDPHPFYDVDEDDEMDFTSETQKLSLQIFEQHLSQFSHTHVSEESDLIGIIPDEPLPLPPCGQQITPPASKAKKPQSKRQSRAKPVQPKYSKSVEQLTEREAVEVAKPSTRPKPHSAAKKKTDTNVEVEAEPEVKSKAKRTRKSGKKAKEESIVEPEVHFNIPKFLFNDERKETFQGQNLDDDNDDFFMHNIPTAPKDTVELDEDDDALGIRDDKRPLSVPSEEMTSTDSILERPVKSQSKYFDPNLINPEEKVKMQKSLLSLNNCPLCREFWPTLSEDKDGKIVSKSKRVCKTATGPKRISHLHMCAKKNEQTYEEVISLLRRDKVSLDKNRRFERIKEMQEESVWEELCGGNLPCTQVQTSVQKMLKSKKNWYKIDQFVRGKAQEDLEIQAKKKSKRVRLRANGGTDRETSMIEMPIKGSHKDVEKCHLLFGPSTSFKDVSVKDSNVDDVICTNDPPASFYDHSDQACEMPFESICRARKRKRVMQEGHPENFNSSASSLCTMGILFGERLAKSFKSKQSCIKEC
ncbi:hypothetical protein L7F22_019769 [Adiantum nelumboides]|nr:hypothetical protein [Adiantum nelumboides]